jgi:hypothetical protein
MLLNYSRLFFRANILAVSGWMPVAYIILILFLIAKPLGFSGKRLKKIEV